MFRHEVAKLGRRGPRNFTSCYEGLKSFVNVGLNASLRQKGGDGDCRILPQAAFTYEWSPEREQVNPDRRLCKHVLRFQDLPGAVNGLFASRGLHQRLEASLADPPAACAMLNSRCLGFESRALIESALADDFRLLGFKVQSWPEFIHIPRTGGTTVEAVAKKFERWGSDHPGMNSQSMVLPGGGKCYKQHVPTSMMPEIYGGGRETWCMVRDVYKRVVSEFGFQMMHGYVDLSKFACDAASLNKFVLEHFPKANQKWRNVYQHDCHLVPQAAYVYRWDPSSQSVDRSARWCTHVLRTEHMRDHLNAFWKRYGYPMRLENQKAFATSSKGECTTLTAGNLTAEAKAIIRGAYPDDFALLEELDAEAAKDADKDDLHAAAQTPPPKRILLHEEIGVDASACLVEDIATSEQFELSFVITPEGVRERYSSILRITNTTTHVNHAGDGIPRCGFVGGTTRIVCYMGHLRNHNSDCKTKSNLTLGQQSHVVVRLSSSSFSVQVDGVEACLKKGFEKRYGSIVGARLYVGDAWDPPAIALVSDVVYSALGSGA